MNRVQSLLEASKDFYNNGDPSHDMAHIERVMKNCQLLSQHEKFDLELTLAAAILHDIVNLPKNHPERKVASQMAAQKSEEILKQSKFSQQEIEKIQTIILEHSFSLGKTPSFIESAILQDADKLDALGAIGIMRTVTCGAKMGSNYYDQTEPFTKTRELNDKAYTLDHFFVKLFKLPDLMNTEAAKIEGKKRVAFMNLFLEQLKFEI